MKKREDMKLPKYYTILPAEVRYNKTISASAKILYGDICLLAAKEGFCSASNEYLGFLYDVDDKTVSAWVKQLDDIGFVRSNVLVGGMRKIYPKVAHIPSQNNTTTQSGKAEGDSSGKADTNNTSINTNISKDISAEADLPIFDSKQYFTNVAKGKKKQQRIIAFFGLKKKKYEGMKSAKECNAFLYNPRLCSVAKRMEDFPDDNINKAFYVAENMTIRGERVDWSLELVEKQLLK